MSDRSRVALTPFPFRVPRHPAGAPLPDAAEQFAFQVRACIDVPSVADGIYACVPAATVSGFSWVLWSEGVGDAPEITDFTNANHDHSDTDDGGTLTVSAIPALAAAFTPASAAGPASFAFHEDTDNGTSKITVVAPSALSGNFTHTLPAASGTTALAPTITVRNNDSASIPTGSAAFVIADCLSGEVCTGGGYAISHTNTGLLVYYTFPQGNGWVAGLRNDAGISVVLTAYAVCAKFGA
jgi:hypothetical protein